MSEVPLYEGILGCHTPENSSSYQWEPPCVPQVSPAVGPVDYSLADHWFRGVLVFRAHSLLLSLNSRLESNKEEGEEEDIEGSRLKSDVRMQRDPASLPQTQHLICDTGPWWSCWFRSVIP